MDADRMERIRANADRQLAIAKNFEGRKAVEISDEDWDSIEVLVEEDHTINRKKPRTNYTWNQSGRVKRATIARIKFEQKLKAKGMTVEQWRAYQVTTLPKVVKATLIKKNPE